MNEPRYHESSFAAPIIESDSEPDVEPGRRWRDTRNGRTYLRYRNSNSAHAAWVEIGLDATSCSLQIEMIRQEAALSPSADAIAAAVARAMSASRMPGARASLETRQEAVANWHAYADPIAVDERRLDPGMTCRAVARRVKLRAKDALRTATDPQLKEVLRKIEALDIRSIADRVCATLGRAHDE